MATLLPIKSLNKKGVITKKVPVNAGANRKVKSLSPKKRKLNAFKWKFNGPCIRGLCVYPYPLESNQE